jgi:hypothetical protein
MLCKMLFPFCEINKRGKAEIAGKVSGETLGITSFSLLLLLFRSHQRWMLHLFKNEMTFNHRFVLRIIDVFITEDILFNSMTQKEVTKQGIFGENR